MKFITKLFIALIAAISFLPTNAQIFDHLGAGVGVGTNGISIDVATNITRFVQVRAGVDIMPGIKFNSDADFEYSVANDTRYGTVDLKGDLGRTQGHIIFNVYPFPIGSFYVAAGAYFAGNKLVKITGHSDELGQQSNDGYAIIGDYRIPVDANGNIRGGLKVKSFRPYLGLGWGRAIPGKLLAFGIDLGVQFEGKPEVYTDYGEIDQSLVDDDNTFNKIRDALSVYPTLTFKLNFRAF